MKWFFRTVTLGALLAANFLALPVPAQPSNSPAQPHATNLASNPPLPEPPSLKSPVEVFRELLDMTPVERLQFLQGRSAENRRLILDKIREYQALTPEQRDARLNVTELRWYLLPLMKMPETNWAARVEAIPNPEMRKLVQDRLRIWRLLPPDLTKELLDNETAVRYLSELAIGLPPRTNSSPQLQTNVATYQALPARQQLEISRLFDAFFGLTPNEQESVLRRMSGPESQQIEKTLRIFRELTPQQRGQCLRSFEKFAALNPNERQQFLKDAQKWEEMPPSDRQAFRALVERASMQPPPPTAMAPRPLPSTSLRRVPQSATNN